MRKGGGDGGGDGASAAAAKAAAPPPPPPQPSDERRLPWRFVWALLFNNFAQAVMLTLPFTLATYMVRDWLHAEQQQQQQQQQQQAAPPEAQQGDSAAPAAATSPPPVDERRVGELTGLLTAAYSLSQACTSIPLGKWSDRHGRRPVLLVAAAASTLSVAAFGLSGALLPALIARAAGGALNAFIGAWKTALAEATGGHEGEQARVMALMGLAWGLGCVLGPASGGALARPCRRRDAAGGLSGGAPLAAAVPLLCGENRGLFEARPYALPCLVVAGVCAASGLMTWFWLPETLGLGAEGLLLMEEQGVVRTRQGGGSRGGDCTADEEEAGAETLLSPPPAKRPGNDNDNPDQGRKVDAAPVASLRRVVVSSGGDGPAKEDEEEEDADVAAAPPRAGCQQRRPGSAAAARGSLELQPIPSFSKFKRLPYDGRVEDDDDDDESGENDAGNGRGALLGGGGTTEAAAPPPPPRPPWHRCPRVRHALAGYGLICLHFIALEELVPLWASAPFDAGGLARQPAQLALPLALNGASLVFFAAVAYPRLRAAMGTVPLLRAGAALGAGVAALMPLPSLPLLLRPSSSGPAPEPTPPPAPTTPAHPHDDPPPPLPALALSLWLFLMALKAAAQAGAFTGAMIRVNVVGRKAGSLGSINGVGQTLASLARGLGPAGAGLAWAAAVWLRESGVLPPPWPAQFVPFWAVAAIAVWIWAWFGRREAEEEEAEER